MSGIIIVTIAYTISCASAACVPNPNSEWTGEFVRYAPKDTTDDCTYTGPFYGFIAPDDTKNYKKFDRRQYLHFRIAADTSTGPAPVYFFAHGNGGQGPGIGGAGLNSLVGQGYAVIAWESLTSIENERNVQTCADDFELVIQWAVTNAAQYGFDVHRFVIGGRSRGSVVSWRIGQSHSPHYTVSGIYMYNALPINDEAVWQNTSGFPLVDVTPNSPRTYFLYGPECPTNPPQASCNIKTDLGGDIHNPWHGQKIVAAYEALGIGAKITLRQGCKPCTNIMQDFPDFAATISGGGGANTTGGVKKKKKVNSAHCAAPATLASAAAAAAVYFVLMGRSEW